MKSEIVTSLRRPDGDFGRSPGVIEIGEPLAEIVVVVALDEESDF